MSDQRGQRRYEWSQDENEDVVIELEHIDVTFSMDRGRSRVLDDVSIPIRREEILGVVGESGSGKSMFASSMLDAVVDPGNLSGDITYYPPDGQDPVDVLALDEAELKQFRWEEVSMVFQGAMSSFNPTQRIRTHFAETLAAHDHDVESGLDRARDLLRDLHLEPERVLDSYPHELSGGMSQRALIALSLILDPEILVMDEPTAALDLLMQRSILSLLKELQEKYELTIVFITHDLPLVAGLADRLAVMYAFKFVEVGPAGDVISDPAHPYTRALLNAVPNLAAPLDEMEPIEGSSPDPINLPQGCSYHPRCSLATDECRTEEPSFFDAGEDHDATCYHLDEARSQIPLASDDPATDTEVIEGRQSSDPVVSLDGVTVHFEEESSMLNLFADGEEIHAVDDVDLDIYENDVVALVGESGCGKTTLGRAAIAAQRPTGGTVEFRGQDVWDSKDGVGEVDIEHQEIRRSLQMVHQDPGSSLNPNRTVLRSLEAPLKRWHDDLNPDDRVARIYGMLEYVGMSPPQDYADRYPHQLSGGEKQRVALVRALLMNPDLILADEAVSALDVSLRVEMMDLMLELQEEFGTSYLFVSHNLANARYLAGKVGGRIGVMYMGELVEIGPAEQIIRDPRHPYTKALRWATVELQDDPDASKPPVRTVDIPDPRDPPAGCRFHTRCPEAREVCAERQPELEDTADGLHRTACFREYGGDHPYWDSPELAGDATE